MHISGIHGIEGYLGSAIQTAILEDPRFTPELFLKCNHIFVHALNPFGMSWYRRVNAHNVDLNRNYYREEADRPLNTEFNFFSPLFEKRQEGRKLKTWRNALLALIRLGITGTAEAIAKGQYHLPDSLFYGGKKIEPETEEMFRALKKVVGNCKKLVVIDVHSGLGRFKNLSWILDGLQSDEEDSFWQKSLPEGFVDISKNKKFYRAKGTLSDAFRDQFVNSQVFFAVSEFGTRNPLRILRELNRENRSFLKLKLDRLRAYRMISTFFPFDKGWRQHCIQLGLNSYYQIQQNLTEDTED